MAKIVNTVTFKNAYINLEDNSIIEITKEDEVRYNLAEVFNRFKDTSVTLTIKEDDELETEDKKDEQKVDVIVEDEEPLYETYVEHEVTPEVNE